MAKGIFLLLLLLAVLLLPLLLHQKHILYQRHEHESERSKQKVVDGLEVGNFGHVVIHGTSHKADGQNCSYPQSHAVRAFSLVNPKAHPRQNDDTDAWDVHLEDEIHRPTSELDSGCQTRERLCVTDTII